MPAQEDRHPFLDDLTEDAVLTSSVLRGPVQGRAAIRRTVAAVGRLYAAQTPRFMAETDARLLLGYEARLKGGEALTALVAAERMPAGAVTRVSVQMGPLGAVLALATALRDALAEELPADLFL